MTPQAINLRYEELMAVYQSKMPSNSGKNRQKQNDYNKMVAKLNEEAQKEAHNNYLAKLRKKRDIELRM